MTRGARLVLLVLGLAAFGTVLVVALAGIPGSGGSRHPYGDRAVTASVSLRRTANVVSSVNFDQRSLDTLGEELIFFTAVLGTLSVLGKDRDEEDDGPDDSGRDRPPLDGLRLAGYVMLPVTVLLGLYLVGHGHLSPGGGFQGGIVMGTAVHIVYLAGSHAAIRRARPEPLVEVIEALGAASFLVFGIATAVFGSGVLANELPYGTFGSLLSAGAVEPLNAAVGLEVAGGVSLMVAKFLEQALQVRKEGVVTWLPYAVAAYLVLLGIYGIATSRNLVHAVVCLSVCQSGTYVLLLSIGFRKGGTAPVFGDAGTGSRVVDPVVQALVLTDVVVGAAVTALLLAIALQVHKRHGTLDPDALSGLRG